MLVNKFKHHFFEELSSLYPETEIQSFFNILLKEHLSISRIELALQPQLEFSKNQYEFFQKALENLKKEIPIQYIIGTTNFYGLPFKVNENVLIPRPETEELVEWIITSTLLSNPIKILDIGTGSGCIAISLAKNISNAEVCAIDISLEAIKTAQKNAEINHVNVHFIETNILNTEKLPAVFDIIVSNPPYVSELEKKEMKKNVLANEPHLALFVENNNPLLFYDKIADLAKTHLTKNGTLYFEINQYLGNETVELLKLKGYKTIELKKDIYGADRMIKAQL